MPTTQEINKATLEAKETALKARELLLEQVQAATNGLQCLRYVDESLLREAEERMGKDGLVTQRLHDLGSLGEEVDALLVETQAELAQINDQLVEIEEAGQ